MSEERTSDVKGAPAKSRQSTFSHFMLEAEGIVNAKEIFKQKLEYLDFSSSLARLELINKAKSMQNDEVHMLFKEEDNKSDIDSIRTLEQLHSDILLLERQVLVNSTILNQRIAMFRDCGYRFLKSYSTAQHNAKLGLQTVKEKSEFDRFFSILDVPKTFKNSYGVTISPEMLVLALGLVMRTMRAWDNVLTIDAMPGTGKTTFDFALTTTMLDIYKTFYQIDVPFSIEQNVFVAESREYCNKVISHAPKFSIFMFIEAGNQFNSKGTWEDDQQELVNTVERIRFHGLTMPLEWNTIEGLDKTMRDRRATLVVSMEERGKAIVRGFNRNPGKRGLTQNPRTKNAVAMTAMDASAILDADALKVLEVACYALPKDWQDKLDERKEQGTKYISAKKTAEKFYGEFLASLPENVVRITSEELAKYSIDKHYVLSIRKLSDMIAKSTGKPRNKVFINTSIADYNEGYIEVDEIIRSYVAHMKAQWSGAIQYEKERGESE